MPALPSNARQPIVLSRQEMCIISQTIRRDFSPRLFGSRVAGSIVSRFSPQELCDISRQISREYAPSKSTRQSRLVLLAVSPRRLHAYWHLAKRRLTRALQQDSATPALTLRIYAEADVNSLSPENPNQASKNWLDVPITRIDGQQDIWLPEPLLAHSGTHYRAELGELNASQIFCPQVTSNATQAVNFVAPQASEALPEAWAQYIMTDYHPVSSAAKIASGQGK